MTYFIDFTQQWPPIHICRKILAKCTIAWRKIAENEKIAEDFQCRCKNRIKCRIFLHWRRKAAMHQHLRHLCDTALQKKQAEVTRGSFQTWREATSKRKLLKRVFGKALESWGLKLQVERYYSDEAVALRVLNAWSLVLHAGREERRLEGISLKLCEIQRRKTLSKSLGVWISEWRQSKEVDKEREVRLEEYVKCCRAAVISSVFSSWRTFVAMHNARYVHYFENEGVGSAYKALILLFM